MIRSELKYLIGAKNVSLKCRVFGGKTGPFPMVRVFRVVRPVATVRVRVEPYPEPAREFGPVANTKLICLEWRMIAILMTITPGCRYKIFDCQSAKVCFAALPIHE